MPPITYNNNSNLKFNETFQVFQKDKMPANFKVSEIKNSKEQYLPKEKEKTFDKKLIAWLSAATAGGLLITCIGFGLIKPSLVKKVIDNLESKRQSLKKPANPGLINKSMQKILHTTQTLLMGTFNIISNISVAKDYFSVNALKKMDKNKGIVTQIIIKTTDFFSNLAKKSAKNKYTKLFKYLKILKESNVNSVEIMSKLEKIEESLKKLDNGFGKRCKNLEKKMKTISKDFFKEYNDLLSSISGKQTVSEKLAKTKQVAVEAFAKGSQSFISEKNVKPLQNVMQKKLKSESDSIIFQLDELLKLAKTKELELKINVLKSGVNEAVKFETSNLFQRLRDLALGAAPLEALGLILPIPYIGYKFLNATDEKERKKTLLKEGIPLSFGMAGWAYSSIFRLFNAPQALAFSIITGGVFAKIGSYLENKYDAIYNKNKPKEYFS